MTCREHTLRRRVHREEMKRRYKARLYLAVAVIAWLAFVVAMLLANAAEVRGGGGAGEAAGEAPFREAAVAERLVHIHDPAPTGTPAPEAWYPLTDGEREWVEWTVAAESANQSLEGQMAVALCILNTAQAKGIRPDQVVQEPGQYADPAPGRVTDSVREAVSLVFDQGVWVTEEPIRYFYAPRYSAGAWHESALEYVVTIGGHKFFKEAGA